MNETSVIEIQGLSKRYRIGSSDRYRTLRDALVDAAGRIARPIVRRKGTDDDSVSRGDEHFFWALNDVNLSVSQGEIVGIVGRNGAGKTTLLKILSRITKPTRGEATLYGRVGALLEVGTAFHPELTGRENIFLNGSVLGMKRAEIVSKLSDIIEFAGVERFIDTPVKRYSSGMQLRLGFSVAAHLEPEILLVDEVLAVGDVAFQRKCIGKMEEVAGGGRTVLFVSHNMEAVGRLCTRVVALDGGRVTLDGPSGEVIDRYMESASGAVANDPNRRATTSPMYLNSIQVLNSWGDRVATVDMQQPFTVEIEYDVREGVEGGTIAFVLADLSGNHIINSHDNDLSQQLRQARQPGRYVTRVTVPGGLLSVGRYEMMAFAGNPDQRLEYDSFRNLFINIDDLSNSNPVLLNGPMRRSTLALALQWDTEHAGQSTQVAADS